MKTTIKELKQLIADAVMRSPLASEKNREKCLQFANDRDDTTLYISRDDFRGVWGASVSIQASIKADGEKADGEPEVELSWSCTKRSLAMAIHTVSHYQAAIQLAAEIEALIQCADIQPATSQKGGRE